MSNWMSNLRAFGRQANPARNQNAPPSRGNTSSPSAYGQANPIGPAVAAAPPSPSISQSVTHNDQAQQTNANEGRIPLFFKEPYAGLVVKGNFDTLAVTPALVDEGEWLAHQLVEQARLMGNMITVVIDKVDKTAAKSVCTEQTCPTMTSSPGVVYTWVDTQRNPINLPAAQYIKNIQTWVNGKIANPSLFPTDTFSSAPPMGLRLKDLDLNDKNKWLGSTYGFPQAFYNEVKNLYKQMFRCYAHLYWAHWLTFWDLECYRELNTCFVHFNNVGRRFGLISDRDTEPMQGLINLWVQQGVLPKMVTDGAAQASGPSGGSASKDAAAASAAAAGPASEK
ncbi:Mob1/phocein [Teratosphaeria nubilosa]|uniref:Mob1/phocein n=1 Tax=Teratosphaeria nubilosa TaxID=161662 RepID=A0A6G1L6C2_9PEZI|nr:Mob1/phocein [Teratosphaeria nubilosa]